MSTKFSFEVPLKHLDDFDEDQDFLFTLSFLFASPEYCTYVSDKAQGRPVWVDNSTNELKQPDSIASLLALYKGLSADFVVAPDHPDWNQESMLLKWLELSKLASPERTFCVIHHPDWIGHFTSYGVVKFAAPYDFRYCSLAKLMRFSECHFLGLLSVRELQLAKPPTCDTSMPIKLAFSGLSVQEWVEANCPHIHSTPGFFDQSMTLEQVKKAKENIKELRSLLSEEDIVNNPKHYTQGKIEVLDFITDQQLPYLPSTVLKYLCRYRYKNGLEDLKKAEFYLKRLIKEVEDEGTCT